MMSRPGTPPAGRLARLFCCWRGPAAVAVGENPEAVVREVVEKKTPQLTAVSVPVQTLSDELPERSSISGKRPVQQPSKASPPSKAQKLQEIYEHKAKELRAIAPKSLVSSTYDPSAPPSFKDMLDAVQDSRLQAKADMGKYQYFLEGFAVGIQRLQRFGQALDVLCQSSQVASLVWGSFRMLIIISCDIFDTFERVYEVLEGISESLPRFETYTKVFEDPAAMLLMLEPLCRIYRDIVDFCITAIKLYDSPLLKTLGRSLWQVLSKEMGGLTARLKAHADEADRMAMAAHMIDANSFQKGLTLFVSTMAAVLAVPTTPGKICCQYFTFVARIICMSLWRSPLRSAVSEPETVGQHVFPMPPKGRSSWRSRSGENLG
ncbi:hypothetical protein FN846DRAFT_280914 [Sphaerosporella brunnea]|uniref:DUF7708 domain-containing protein n=1 Tax=Sphaerosporella brunnea TaxID=1250544 RepID=A0A5J5EM35_9PEZI|nr:hypothetical protein FN846DRAFT_280914 [Sphaerosporella brunnea]